MTRSLVFAFLMLSSSLAFGFPELIRHGYVNCSACHATAQGGDILSPYGRELSKELLSRNDSIFKEAGSEKKYLELRSPDWLQLGAHLRLLQSFSESSAASKGRFMIMQIETEALAHFSESWMAFGSLGRFEATKSDAEWKDFIYVPAIWVRYQLPLSEQSAWALRAGRFFPVYGIWVPEHPLVNRSYLGLNPGEERMAVEASWVSENYQIFATGIQARASNGTWNPEKGGTLQISKVFGNRSRAGLNVYRSRLDVAGTATDKSYEGLFAIIGYSKELSILAQVDKINGANAKTGFLNLLKFSYGLEQGLEVFATQEYANLDTEKSDPRYEAYGLGVRYFPIPNVDLSGTFREQKDSSQSSEFEKKLWFLAHLYL